MAKTIDELWAFCAIDPTDGNEGIVGAQLDGSWFPLVGADLVRVASYRAVARRIGESTQSKIILKRFSTMTVEEVIYAHPTT